VSRSVGERRNERNTNSVAAVDPKKIQSANTTVFRSTAYVPVASSTIDQTDWATIATIGVWNLGCRRPTDAGKQPSAASA
jgi:hypothetical protein